MNLQKAVLLDDPTSSQFKKWELNSNAPLILSAYVYDVQNPEGVTQGEKPVLIERGPFVYRVRLTHAYTPHQSHCAS